MREIKFRAYHKPTGTMIPTEKLESINFETKVVGLYIEMNDRNFNRLRMKDFELMQFTGMYDKNGTPIYEGDILRIVDQKGNEHLIEVEYENYSYLGKFIKSEALPIFTVVEYACGEYEHIEYEVHDESEFLFIINQFLEFAGLEVIGNKHENPELLKGEKE